MKEQTMIKCNTCKACDVNTNSDEAYCEANDGEQIILSRGQCRPSWCPKHKQRLQRTKDSAATQNERNRR